MERDFRLILRYDDRTAETATEHRDVADASGHVWWGWWRKDGIESNRLELLVRLQRSRNPFRVGLVNRDRGEAWAALCEGVAFLPDGSRLQSPDPALTPRYYDLEHCAAWFLLRDFENYRSLETWEVEFGSVPLGEPTMFESNIVSGARITVPSPDWRLESVAAAGRDILHISDLHFGVYHGYPLTPSAPGRGVLVQPLAARLTECLKKQDAEVGIVVVSGDCISKGDNDAFTPLESFLSELATGLGLGPEHFVIVPGNHDFHNLAKGTIPSMTYAHERDFRRFLNDFYGSTTSLERIQRFRMPDDWDVTFVVVNSARLREDGSNEYGYVGRDRYERMLQYAAEAVGSASCANRQLFAAILHHHLLPVPRIELPHGDRSLSLTVDAAALMGDLYASGVQVVFHGHQHLPFIAASRRAVQDGDSWRFPASGEDLFVVGMGSTGAISNAIADELRDNTFGLYEPSTDGLRVKVVAFNPGRESRAVFADTLPLR